MQNNKVRLFPIYVFHIVDQNIIESFFAIGFLKTFILDQADVINELRTQEIHDMT
ncbi:hypothetical protein D3C87_1705680 [compost metagenome]